MAKTKYTSPPNQSKGILDDHAVRKSVQTIEGTVERVPSNDSDVVNKKFLDDNYATIADDVWLKNTGDTGTGDYIFDGAVTINEAGLDKDFRVEGVGKPNALFVQGSDGRVGIGTNTPRGLFELSGPAQTSQYFTETNNMVTYGFGALGGFFKIQSLGSFWGGSDVDMVRMYAGEVSWNQGRADIDLSWSGNTTANLFFCDAGTETISLGGKTTLNFNVDKDGDTYWKGAGSGIPFANVYGNEIAWTQASAAQNTWYPIVDADMTSGELNLITHDNNGKITFAKAGRYKINLDFALEANSANVHIQVASRVNTTVQNAYNHTEIKFSNTQEAVSLSTIVSVSANDTLEAVLRTTDGGAPNITVDHLVITATMVGG